MFSAFYCSTCARICHCVFSAPCLPRHSPNAKSPGLPFQTARTRRSVQKPLFPPRRAHSVSALFTPVPVCSPQPGAHHLFLSLCPGSPVLTSPRISSRPAPARAHTRPSAPASGAPPQAPARPAQKPTPAAQPKRKKPPPSSPARPRCPHPAFPYIRPAQRQSPHTRAAWPVQRPK